jgi:inorganic triphosphatase YgiF
MTFHAETEFKLRATERFETGALDEALRATGVTCRFTDAAEHEDTYLDDGSGSLAAHGIALRLRKSRQGSVLCWKTSGEPRGELFVREELEQPVAGDQLPGSAQDLPGELRDAVEPFVLQRPLVPRLQLVVQRETRELELDGAPLCELALDHVTVAADDGRRPTFTEVEIEVHDQLDACEHLAATLSAQLPLQPATDDKLRHALSLLATAAPAESPEQPDAAAAGVAVAAGLAPSLARHLQAMQHSEVGVRLDRGPEALHGLRVALRRLRVLVRAFRAVWPTEVAGDLQEVLARESRELGGLRDLEVMLLALDDAGRQIPEGLREGIAVTGNRLRAQQKTARARVLAMLRDPGRLADLARVHAACWQGAMTGPVAAEPLRTVAAARLGKAVRLLKRRLRALPDGMPVPELHELRIAGKRARYLAEELAPLGGRQFGKGIRRLLRVQQTLGEVCDHELLAGRALDLVAAEATDNRLACAGLGAIAMHQHALSIRARKAAARQLARLDKKRTWRALSLEQDA